MDKTPINKIAEDCGCIFGCTFMFCIEYVCCCNKFFYYGFFEGERDVYE